MKTQSDEPDRGFSRIFGMIFCNEDYDELRKVDGQEATPNLKLVKTSLLNARATLEMMDVDDEDIYEFIDSDYEEVMDGIFNLKYSIYAYGQPLSDNTTIGGFDPYDPKKRIFRPRKRGMKWSELKKHAMKENYPMDYLHVSNSRFMYTHNFILLSLILIPTNRGA